jgi:hypothetical protein
MSFNSSTYANLVSTTSPTHQRLFPQYSDSRNDFDIIIIGSGIGGGVLADDLGDRVGANKRIFTMFAVFRTHRWQNILPVIHSGRTVTTAVKILLVRNRS